MGDTQDKKFVFDKTKVTMNLLDYKIAKKMIIENHYSHRMSNKQVALGFYYEKKLNLVIIYGSSATARMKKSLPNPNYMELTRLFSFDWAGKNMESYCIGQSIKYIKGNFPNIKVLISFADPEQGHVGYIYQATNWIYCGLSLQTGGYTYFFDNKWQHPRTTVSKYGTRKHSEILKIKPNIKFKRIARKHRYIYFLGTHKEKKEMLKNLKYKVLPYPKLVNDKPFAEEVSKKTRLSSTKESSVQVANSAPISKKRGRKKKVKVEKKKEVIALTRAKYTKEDIGKIMGELSGQSVYILDLETTGLNPRKDKIIGIGLGTLEKEWYLFAGEINWHLLQDILNDHNKTMVGHNLTFDVDVLKNSGHTVKNKLWCTKAAAFLIDENRSLKLKDLGKSMYGLEVVKFEDVEWDNPNKVEEYGKQDIKLPRLIYNTYKVQIDNYYPIFYKLYMPLIPTIIEVQNNGIKINLEYLDEIFWELKDDVEALKSELDEEIKRITGCKEVNEKMHNSPKQLRELFFDKLGLKPVHISRKTKQPSTDERTLRVLAMRGSKLANILLRYRGKNKLFTTYVQPIIERTEKDTNRLHTTYNPFMHTGRWNSSKPNLQNIPIKDAGLIRQAFIAEPNNVLLIADYSQIELRLLAHFSQDSLFMLTYTQGLDLHKKTAAAIFNKSENSITDDERAIGKKVNFSVIYGISPFRLAEQLNIQIWDATKYIDTFFNTYKGVTAFRKNVVDRCKQTKYIETLFFRKRRLPNINATKRAERQAVNSKIQGSAADIINRAIIQLSDKFKGTDLKILLQVHDEIVMECPKLKADFYMAEIKKIMEASAKLVVPLKCSVKACSNWSEK